jgi:hypothetical protein
MALACMRTTRLRAPTLFEATAIRRATREDAPQITVVARDAYEPYIERIGRPPAPMTENLAYYSRRGYVSTHSATEHGFWPVYLTRHLGTSAPRHLGS